MSWLGFARLRLWFAAIVGLALFVPAGLLPAVQLSPAQVTPRGPEDFRKGKKLARVFGSTMAYYEVGAGPPVVFLHGNPTSSYLWRNVLPHVEGHGRLIAPDLIGMGDSAKLEQGGLARYRFSEQMRFLEELLRVLRVEGEVVLVLHDWGGSLGFEWAYRHANEVAAIAFMETFVVSQTAENTPDWVRAWYTSFREPEKEAAVLSDNAFVERVLLGQFPNMSEEDMGEYRRPFVEPGEGRRPTVTFAQQVPIDGEPREVDERVRAHLAWMASNGLPKLFVRGDPGALISGGREGVPRGWKNVEEVVVPGRHFLPEESPEAIGAALASWLRRVRSAKTPLAAQVRSQSSDSSIGPGAAE